MSLIVRLVKGADSEVFGGLVVLVKRALGV